MRASNLAINRKATMPAKNAIVPTYSGLSGILAHSEYRACKKNKTRNSVAFKDQDYEDVTERHESITSPTISSVYDTCVSKRQLVRSPDMVFTSMVVN